MRERDEPIPSHETLYRWISVGDVNGLEVLPHAIDLARTSVNRDKYWSDPLNSPPMCAELNGLATTREELFPLDLLFNEILYEFFTMDWPENDNDAHAEIRSGRRASADRPHGDRPDGFKPGSKAAKEQLRVALAVTMTVMKRPVPPA